MTLFKRAAGLVGAAALVFAVAAPGVAFAQGAAATRPAADPNDVASLDAIMTALYDVISGPAGEARDWDRMRSLFIDGARLIPRSTQNPAGVVVWTVEDYINNAGPGLVTNGFFEIEIGRTTEQYGDIAHVFTAYAAKRKADDPAPFMRGINSVQLLNHGGRWWIVTIYWQSETPQNPVPEKYIGVK